MLKNKPIKRNLTLVVFMAYCVVTGSSSWCPQIYFNYRCFTGPYLSKGRLMLLPQSVGPGPVNLVMREVLTMLINVAYKSSRVLRELQLDGAPNPSMQQQVLGAKYVRRLSCVKPGFHPNASDCVWMETVLYLCRSVHHDQFGYHRLRLCCRHGAVYQALAVGVLAPWARWQ